MKRRGEGLEEEGKVKGSSFSIEIGVFAGKHH